MSIALPGFANPVLDAQSCFRAVLDAMARPGTIHATGHALTPPPPLSQATAAVLLTLIDAETGLTIAPGLAAAAEWIAFHCGPCPGCDFIVTDSLPDLATLDAGSDEVPEGSATVILQVAALGAGTAFTLAGPGLQHPTRFQATGLPPGFIAMWAANHRLYPRGIDLILCAGDQLAALPRSVSIGEG